MFVITILGNLQKNKDFHLIQIESAELMFRL